MRSKNFGFTLVEMVVTVAILAIIVSIAYPSYQNQIRRATRADAKAGLLDALARQERYFTENNTYSVSMSDIGMPAAKSPEEYYDLSASAGPSGSIASSVTMTATIVDSSRDSVCTTLTYSSNGAKSASSSTCW